MTSSRRRNETLTITRTNCCNFKIKIMQVVCVLRKQRCRQKKKIKSPKKRQQKQLTTNYVKRKTHTWSDLVFNPLQQLETTTLRFIKGPLLAKAHCKKEKKIERVRSKEVHHIWTKIYLLLHIFLCQNTLGLEPKKIHLIEYL